MIKKKASPFTCPAANNLGLGQRVFFSLIEKGVSAKMTRRRTCYLIKIIELLVQLPTHMAWLQVLKNHIINTYNKYMRRGQYF